MASGGGPQSTQDLTTAEEVASSTLTPLSVDGFGGLEVGLSDGSAVPGPSCSAAPPDPVSSEPEAETSQLTQPRSIPPRQSAPRRRRSGDDQPFLDQQRNGFTMLERELRGIKLAIGSVNTRLIRMEHRRLNLSSTLLRLAVAVERLATQPPQTLFSNPHPSPKIITFQQFPSSCPSSATCCWNKRWERPRERQGKMLV
ncbi:hypothetical protein SKAU_G00350580 [Synaphobranchus kaupii]|uniref:Uncharacterized protein n=1 Tax=Synaphobranchus kaupii TaxID=118154 RepID=A0A9Q1IH69_SYNKA|nr:hypothetical protein SKAU_G00350580 [Synaphobranchus kaupii]